jgi:hypothetical protein
LIVVALALVAALSGPANCRFVVPSDMHAGAAEWIGPCAHQLAEGVGVLRVALPGGKAELFYGELKHGEAVRGIFGASDGSLSNPVNSFNPRTHHSVYDNDTSNPSGQDATLWTLASAAAHVAAEHYAALGNKPSADFYSTQARQIGRGPAE